MAARYRSSRRQSRRGSTDPAETRLSPRRRLADDGDGGRNQDARRPGRHRRRAGTAAAGGPVPQWAGLPVEPVASYGTDHDIYRIGDGLSARLPRIEWATRQAAHEARWLPRLAPHLPLAVPRQLAIGQPALGYPFTWSVQEWRPGRDASSGIGDLGQAAADLAAFIRALRDRHRGRAGPPDGWPRRAACRRRRGSPQLDRAARRPDRRRRRA
ncbi:MAG: phosphotransferase, partial [Streptosporangiaceae bacterium]